MNLTRVLIVDDDPVIRKLIRRYGSELSWECSEASNHQEAVTRLEKSIFDFALVDVNLGADDGIHLAGLIRKKYPAMKVVVMSGDPANENRTQDAGLKQMLAKPFTLEELKTRL